MSIQGLANAPGPIPGGSGQETRRRGTAGTSFREQLAERSLASTAEPARPTLYDAQIAMLEKMKQGKEKQEEEDAWEELMACVDAWIATLRGEGDIAESARACAAVESRKAEEARPAKRLKPADVLLKALTESLS